MSRSLAAAPAGRRATASASPPALGLASLARAVAGFVWPRRRLRIALLAVVVALALLAGGWLWLRQSPFVSVQRVQISGVHGPDAHAVEAALVAAAQRMSTLDVNAGALRAAVAPLRVVRAVRAIPSFPHGLRIEVSEQLPVASLTISGVRTAVAADGVVLGPALLSDSLPSVSDSSYTAGDDADAPAPGRRVSGASLLGALAVLGAAPAPLAKHVERVFTGAKGLTVAMRNGLLVYFGDASRPHAKWLSLARVLADPSSAGASYVDVRLPSRPAAGFPAGVSAPDASAIAGAGSGEQVGSSESTVASLAAGLAGGAAAASPAPTEPASAAPSTSAPSSQGAETTTGETGAESEAEGSQTNPASGGQ
jgi:cell division protein FtsQ